MGEDDAKSRLRRVIGDAGVDRLGSACVAVFGIGGVGSNCAEALVRGGVGSRSIVIAFRRATSTGRRSRICARWVVRKWRSWRRLRVRSTPRRR